MWWRRSESRLVKKGLHSLRFAVAVSEIIQSLGASPDRAKGCRSLCGQLDEIRRSEDIYGQLTPPLMRHRAVSRLYGPATRVATKGVVLRYSSQPMVVLPSSAWMAVSLQVQSGIKRVSATLPLRRTFGRSTETACGPTRNINPHATLLAIQAEADMRPECQSLNKNAVLWSAM